MRWALIAGGTDGIGRAVAAQLAAAGNGVLIVGTNNTKGLRAEREIRRDSGNSQVYFLRADLAPVSEAHLPADEVKSRCDHLHDLVHGAGMVRGHRVLTAEGVESNFAVNYLSRFALSYRLLPLLQATSLPGRSARIALVGGAVRKGPIHYPDISLAKRFTTVRAIRQFQQANNVFTGGAHFCHIRRFQPARVSAAHPPEKGARLWALSEHLIAHGQQRTAVRRGVTFRPNDSS